MQQQGDNAQNVQGNSHSRKCSRRSKRSKSPPAKRCSGSPSEKKNNGSRATKTSASQSGFQEGAHGNRASAVCAVCLGCHGHSFIECTAKRLWDNNFTALATRNNKSLLLRNSDKPLCVDWQRAKSCTSHQHDERHVCSGCLSTSHGAQMCSRAQKQTASYSL